MPRLRMRVGMFYSVSLGWFAWCHAVRLVLLYLAGSCYKYSTIIHVYNHACINSFEMLFALLTRCVMTTRTADLHLCIWQTLLSKVIHDVCIANSMSIQVSISVCADVFFNSSLVFKPLMFTLIFPVLSSCSLWCKDIKHWSNRKHFLLFYLFYWMLLNFLLISYFAECFNILVSWSFWWKRLSLFNVLIWRRFNW